MTPEKIPCSVLILTRNSAGSLDRCLSTLHSFGEILVHDANSEDDSVVIARKHGAKVLKQYETDEKSVRVSDFTAMRLKQRADAADVISGGGGLGDDRVGIAARLGFGQRP